MHESAKHTSTEAHRGESHAHATMAERSHALLETLPDLDADALEQLVAHHNAAYWDLNAPEIDDPTFDKLVEALRNKRPESPVLESLGESVPAPGAERRFAAVEHRERMLSLDKCYDDVTLQKWRDKIHGAVVVTPKIDGVACSIRYHPDGSLDVAATRGDGRVGDDITENVRRIDDIPNAIPAALTAGRALEVRGEVYMRLSHFEKHFAAEFANPRNLTAGALKQKDPEKSGAYGLSFFAYDLQGAGVGSEREKAALLEKIGYKLPPRIVIEEHEDLAQSFRDMEAIRASLDYETDGVVMKVDSVALQEKLGSTAHHPRYALAYKFQGESSQTHLVAVEWSVARTGVITPVAVVDPVFVSGATVTRASLHNAGFIQKLDLSEGATVEIVRRGGVIPHVERVLSKTETPIALPETCPSCAKRTHLEGDFLYCEDPDACPDVVRARVSHFTKVIDVLGFGPKHLAALIESGLVKQPADLYRLKLGDLVSLERMGEKLASKLLAELDQKRKLPLPVFLTALGIDEVGITVAEKLVEHFPTLEALRTASVHDLSTIHGVGPSIADALVTGLAHMKGEIDDLLSEVEIAAAEPPAAADAGHPLFGKGVVFTGKLAHMDRKAAQKMVKEVGGRTPSGVSAELDYLVIGDEGSPLLGGGAKSSKQKTAEKLIEGGARIEIISESKFLDMFR